MNDWLLSLLSGFIGAIIGASIYGWVALAGIKRQIAASVKLQEIGSLNESIASLRALLGELAHNKAHLSESYEGFRAFSLSTEMWRTLAPKLAAVEIETLKKLSRAYLLTSSIHACEESIRSDLQANRQPKGYTFVTTTWDQAREPVDSAISAIGDTVKKLETRLAQVTIDLQGQPPHSA